MKSSVDALVVQGNRIFAYGWAFDPFSRITLARLQITLRDGAVVSLPVHAGKARADVANAFPEAKPATSAGWMVYAAWAGAGATKLNLVGSLEDGRNFSCDLPFTPGAGAVHDAKATDVSINSLAHKVIRRVLRLRHWYHTSPSPGASQVDPPDLVRSLKKLLADSGRSRCALVIDHDMGGGANQFRRAWIEQQLTSRPLVLVLTFELSQLRYVLDAVTVSGVQRLAFDSAEPVTALAVAGLIDEVLYNDAVSFPHPEEVPGWLIALKRVEGTRLVMAVHDYFAICPSQFLLNDNMRFCRVPEMQECLRCLPVNENEFSTLFTSRSMPSWRAAWDAALSVADEIRCFSSSSKHLLLRAYPALQDVKLSIEPHPQPVFERIPQVDLSGCLHIGVVGSIGMHKGAGVIASLADEIERRKLPVRITIIGVIDLPRGQKCVSVTGPYTKADLPKLIEESGANIFLMPSICPETFSYVTQELITLQVPLVSFDFGAPAERIALYSKGRVFPWNNGAELLTALMNFYSEIADERRLE